MKIFIFDMQYANYTKASTPKPSASVMLAAGYHRAKGDSLIFSDEPPKNFALYDIVYINNDADGLFYLQEWLDYPNVKAIGTCWGEEESFFNNEWTKYPPDITIYHDWINRFMKAAPRKHEKVFETFFEYIPFIIKQDGKIVEPSGDKILILDKGWNEWENGFELISQLNVKRLRFAYPIPIDKHWEEACNLIHYCKNIVRDHVWLELTGIIPVERQLEIAKTFKQHKLGRNVKVKWRLHFNSMTEWWDSILPAMDMFECLLTEGNKYLFMSAPEHLYLPDEELKAVWAQFQNWTLFRLKNTRNNLIDNWIFYGINDYDKIMEFLKDPLIFVSKKQRGQTSMGRFLNLLNQRPELVYELSRVQRAPVGVRPGRGTIRTMIDVEESGSIHRIFLPFIHNLFSNDLTAQRRIQKELAKIKYNWAEES